MSERPRSPDELAAMGIGGEQESGGESQESQAPVDRAKEIVLEVFRRESGEEALEGLNLRLHLFDKISEAVDGGQGLAEAYADFQVTETAFMASFESRATDEERKEMATLFSKS